MTLSAAEPTTLRCRNTADLLAALPFLTGYTASNSVFIVQFTGSRSRGAMRIDLPHSDTPAELTDYFDGLFDLLRRSGAGASSPAVVISTEQTFAECGGLPQRKFSERLRRRFAREGWHLREYALVAADGWVSLLGPDEPMLGRPLEEISENAIVDRVPEDLRAPVSLDDMGALPKATPSRARNVARRLEELDAAAAEADAVQSEHLLSHIDLATELSQVVRGCFFSGGRPSPNLVARLVRAAEQPGRWYLLAIASQTRPEFVKTLVGDLTAPFTEGGHKFLSCRADDRARLETIGSLLYEIAEIPPEDAKLQRLLDVLPDVIAHTPEARRTPLLAMLAWAWWLKGSASVAGRILEQAVAIDEKCEFTRIVSRVALTPPEWKLAALTAAA